MAHIIMKSSVVLWTALMLLDPATACSSPKAAAVADDGYSGSVLQKILETGKARVDHDVQIRLFLDEDGRVTDCRRVKGGNAGNVCAAAKSAAPYGQPPYGLPTDILLSFWTNEARAAKETKPALSAAGANSAKTAMIPAHGRYIAKIRHDLRDAMYIPKETQKGVYHATVRLALAKDGSIENSSIIKSSGDATLDKYVMQGIARAAKVSAPPADLKNPVDITFKLVRN